MATITFNNASDTSRTGTNGDDTFNFIGAGSNDTATGLDGSDTFNGNSNYTFVTVSGGLGKDSFSGFGSSSLIYGNQQDDYFDLNGSGSRSTLYGGQGNDQISGTSGSNYLIYGNRGDDLVVLTESAGGGFPNPSGMGNVSAGGNNTVYGGQGRDLIIGGQGADLLVGGQGNDAIVAFGEASRVYGDDLAGAAAGDDAILMVGGQSTAFGGQGADVIAVSGSANLVYGNQGSDKLFDGVTNTSGEDSAPDFGNTTIYGGQGSDQIATRSGANGGQTQSAADDVFYGNMGDDQIFIGADRATVFGGQGNDTIVAVNSTGNPAASDQSVLVGGQGADTFFLNGQYVGDLAGFAPTAITISDFVTGTDRVSFGGPDGSSLNFGTATVNGGLSEAERAAQSSGQTYTFVAGNQDGYLFYNDGSGQLQGTTLTGLNNTAAVRYTDVFGGQPPAAPTLTPGFPFTQMAGPVPDGQTDATTGG